ncbi:MAG: hypothetical protein HOB45_04590 [Planctomycetaceae bacterium]|jgi:hypothetical protein|nr:hypothetical protein [Planctomycetaceae bacterium]
MDVCRISYLDGVGQASHLVSLAVADVKTMQDDLPEDAEGEFDGMLDDPPDDDDMFGPEQSEEEMETLSSEGTVATYNDYFDEAPYDPRTARLRKLWEKCLVTFVIIFLLILISMILYGYVCWIKSRMP